MENIHFEQVTRNNVEQVIALKVKPEQETFIEPNVENLAFCYVCPNTEGLAIYADETLIGFWMYTLASDGNYWLHHIMIGSDFQSHGFGKLAMKKILDFFQREDKAKKVKLGIDPNNKASIRLFASFGFLATGHKLGDVDLYELDLKLD